MATSPRASAPTASSAPWTEIRPFGARAIPTTGATQRGEAVFVQTFRLDEVEKTGDPVRDLRALMNLRHANVARVKEVIEKDSAVTVVSPYVEGETLAALRAHGPIALGVQLRILVDALTGIAAIHGVKDARLKPLGIIHGEIAPANIVVGIDGIPKIIQLCGVHASPGAQGSDTLGYLAPEILLADDAFDHRVDIYGVGVMLWEALSGTTLFPETNAGAIVTRHLSGRIRRATAPQDASWAEPLVDVAQKAIATDPNGRYATANELANEIKRIAKTNLAATMKVANMVKQRGADAITYRRSTLGLAPSPAVKAIPSAPKPTPAPPVAAALKSVPTPSDGPPTTKPVDSSDFVLDSEDLSESSVKPKYSPEPSVHDRITMPTPLAAAPDDDVSDFADFALESDRPPPLPPVASPEPPPVRIIAPVASPAFTFVEQPQTLNPTPPPSPIIHESPFVEPTIESAPPADDARRKRGMIILFAVGGSALLVILLSLRSCLSKTPEATKQPAPAETTVAKKVEPPPPPPPPVATTAEPPPTATASAPTVAKTADPPPPVDTATAEPSAKAPPVYAPPASIGKAAPTSTKPKKTYDPLGI